MADDSVVAVDVPPPLTEREADFAWFAPATGLTTALILVLFMDLGIVVLLLLGKMYLTGLALLGALGLLAGFSLLNAAHLVGPGGVTVQRPFGTESYRWLEFSGWERERDELVLAYAQTPDAPPLKLQTGKEPDKVFEWVEKCFEDLLEGDAGG